MIVDDYRCCSDVLNVSSSHDLKQLIMLFSKHNFMPRGILQTTTSIVNLCHATSAASADGSDNADKSTASGQTRNS